MWRHGGFQQIDINKGDNSMKLAIIGFGVVGSGVAEVFYKNRALIEKKSGPGHDMDIKYILDIRDLKDTPYADKAITDFEILVKDPEVMVVIETIGGLKPAYEFTKRSLQAQKHVITSNKELVATHGAELLKLARENGVSYLFEASVGGGIPAVFPICQCLGSEEIVELIGILNGTTNFIMTRMFVEEMSFEDALELARENGYVEADPSADIEGHDACRKICILASLTFGKHVYPEEVHTEGISGLTKKDVLAADKAGYQIKLIARAKLLPDEKLMAMVSPALVSKNSPLANVSDVFNGIMVTGSSVGDVMFYGRGAGKLPTASAVISDVVNAISQGGNIDRMNWMDAGKDTVCDHRLDVTPWMVRICENEIPQFFGKCTPVETALPGEKVFITRPISGYQIDKFCEDAKKSEIRILSMIRVLEPAPLI